MQFQDLGLPEPILKALADEGYTVPTPIQAQSIPIVLEGRDLLGIAQTGTGKTAAFALPILVRLAADRRPAPRRGCRALILSPTRELASQIAASFRTYGRHMGFRVAVVFGGVSMRAQIESLARGVDILVATPGRLIDHMDSRNAVISGTEIFVLDEADQMLDLGFFRPIRKIVGHLAARRQNLFFSATMPDEISKLASELLQDPVRVAVAPVATTAERVTQKVIHVEHARKRNVLIELLADPKMSRTLVFTRTKRGADRVAKYLEDADIEASAIHGNKSQRQREEALDAFKRGTVRVLVATDIAARGIDVDAVSHVVNFELPEVPEAYVHRIGRTARAGADGSAISLCDGDEVSLLRAIERLTRQSIAAEDRRSDPTAPLGTGGGSDKRRSSGGRRGQQSRDGGRDQRGGRSERPQGGFRQRERGGERRDHGDFRAERRPEARADGAAPERREERARRPRPEGAWRDSPRNDTAAERRPEPRDAGGLRRSERREERAERPQGERREWQGRPREPGASAPRSRDGEQRPSQGRSEGGWRDRPRSDRGPERQGDASRRDASGARREGGYQGRSSEGGRSERPQRPGGDRGNRGGSADRGRERATPDRRDRAPGDRRERSEHRGERGPRDAGRSNDRGRDNRRRDGSTASA